MKRNVPLVYTARVIIDNRCLMQTMQHIDVEERHKAQRWLWGKRGTTIQLLACK